MKEGRDSRAAVSGANFCAWLLEVGAGEATALVEGDVSVSYDQLRQRVRAIAGFVAARMPARGVALIVGDNSIEQIATYLGVLYAGGIAAPVAAHPSDLRAICDAMRPALVLASSDALPGVRRSVPEAVAFDAARAGALLAPVPVPDDATALLLHTSGSTGQPQAVMISSSNLRWSADAILSCVPLVESDRGLLALPTHYCYGASVLHTHLRRGAKLVIAELADPEQFISLIDRHAITNIAGVPSLFNVLLVRKALRDRPCTSLRHVMISGGAFGDRRLAELEAAWPSATIYLRYGITEVTAAASVLAPQHRRAKKGSIGCGLPGAPLAVEDEAGQSVRVGDIGEIVVRGPHVALGYLGAVDPQRAFHDGAYYTGDLATIDADGFVTIVGRRKDFIKTGGHRVSPEEIEDILVQAPGVSQAAVCGVPHDVRGESLIASVVPVDGMKLAEPVLRAHCAAHLPAHMVPVRFSDHRLAAEDRKRQARSPRTSSTVTRRPTRRIYAVSTYLEHATAAARELNLLDADGQLVPLDSLTSVDFVVALEQRTNLEIPSSRLQPAALASVRAVADMLETLAAETLPR